MIKPVRHVHFLGICGTAMGAVAAAMKEQGFTVTGSDEKVFPPMSDFLRGRGIALKEGYCAANIHGDADLVVVGNAIGRGNAELEEVLNRRLAYQSMPETLRNFFLRGRRNLVVAGTHGKTTTAAMLTHILRSGGMNPAFMIGGIAEDLGMGASLHDSETVVIEGDEYDTAFFDKGPKFAHYLPSLAILNAVELDQMDIYADLAAVKKAFGLLMRVLPENGVLIFNADDPNSREVAAASRTKLKFAAGLGPAADEKSRATDLHHEPEASHFTLLGTRFSVPMVGEIYVRNAAMAILAAHHCGVPLDVVQRALAAFRGVLRRQVLRGERDGVRFIEDFGKHPTNIRETIKALRHRFPGARVWAAVDPRSNTMCRAAIQHDLTDALAHADGALIGPVDRPERFEPGAALDPAGIARDLNAQGRRAFSESGPDAIVTRLREITQPGDVVALFSSGSFGGIYEKLLPRE
jgi:UDP-N-acetylmuramate: L-alanyl-gamma-D-glutamyl-meso-diaminopimelate ligase